MRVCRDTRIPSFWREWTLSYMERRIFSIAPRPPLRPIVQLYWAVTAWYIGDKAC